MWWSVLEMQWCGGRVLEWSDMVGVACLVLN